MPNKFFPNYDSYIVTSPFGPRVLNGKKGFHSGIDLVADGGGYGATDYIMAHTGGIVESCGYNSSAGNFVRIRTDSKTVMSYCHFRDSLNWNVGDEIKEGEILGYMGSTGNSTGAHLHWGINYNGEWIDPAPLLDKGHEKADDTIRKTANVDLPVLRQGDSGEDVRAMQGLLILRGFACGNSGADGIFGKATGDALEGFQRYAKISPDRICGKNSWLNLVFEEGRKK